MWRPATEWPSFFDAIEEVANLVRHMCETEPPFTAQVRLCLHQIRQRHDGMQLIPRTKLNIRSSLEEYGQFIEKDLSKAVTPATLAATSNALVELEQ